MNGKRTSAYCLHGELWPGTDWRLFAVELRKYSERLTAFDAGRNTVHLVFARGASTEDMISARGIIPGHDGSGPLHMALAIAADAYGSWRTHLLSHGVPIRSEVHWPAGARSLYFEDPDGHVLEFATPGLWENH